MIVKMFCDLDNKMLKMIATLHFKKWSKHDPQLKLEDAMKEYCNTFSQKKHEIPCGFALFENDILVGFCRLSNSNLTNHPNLRPLISSALVLKKYRGCGYGTKLIRTAEALLKDFGYKTAYLWTDQAPDFYPKIGYEYLQEVKKDDGGIAKLFKKDLY